LASGTFRGFSGMPGGGELCGPRREIGPQRGGTFRLLGDEVGAFVGIAIKIKEESATAGAEHAFFADLGSVERPVPAAGVRVDRAIGLGDLERCAVVAGEDDEGVFLKSVLAEFLPDLADSVIAGG
jgi:hypothetical protein